MKKLLMVMVALLIGNLAMAQSAVVAGTKHNLGTNGSGAVHQTTGTNEVCVFCHTPHNAAPFAAPLWNHTPTSATYTMYSSPTMDMTVPGGQPSGVSAACLSCHDGTVALDNFVNAPNNLTTPTVWTSGGGFMPVGSNGLLGIDLSNDHPISITYDNSAAGDTAFNPAAAVEAANVPLFGTIAAPSAHTQVECGSCHNVHNDSIQPFLRISNANSALCLACHIK